MFKFKEFNIQQDKTAMKIGTDGVLLGAWASIDNNPYSILDIGTGTGLLALQLAQRSNAGLIDAIEINNNAFVQAVNNFEQSKWNDRLFCYHTSLANFVNEINDKYDLIISNPPFYTKHYKSLNKNRNQARSTDSLSFKELLFAVSILLNDKGTFNVIIPYKEKIKFINIANSFKLFPNKICNVKGNINSKIKRSLIEFSFDNTKPIKTTLIIEIKRHNYTKEYSTLIKDFYLNF